MFSRTDIAGVLCIFVAVKIVFGMENIWNSESCNCLILPDLVYQSVQQIARTPQMQTIDMLLT